MFSLQKGAIIRGQAINRGGRLFQILLAGSANVLISEQQSNKGKSQIYEHHYRKNKACFLSKK